MPALAESLTFYDGEVENQYVPIYGWYADSYNKCEMIMPGDDLSEMTGATLTKMTWYLSTPAEASWGTASYQVYLKEVNETTFGEAFLGVEGATLVYEGTLDGTQPTIDIEFATGFAYEGGNLLIAVYQVGTGSYKKAFFAGVEAAGASVSNYSYSSLEAITTVNARNFLPKTTFEFTPGSGVVYYKPKNLQASEIGMNSATLTWEAGGTEASWNVEYKLTADADWTAAGNVTEKTITLEDLQNGKGYDARVQSVYADGESGWTQISFATTACEETDMGEVEYTLTDTYGDGWNGGGKLQIFLHGTNVLVQELTLPAASGNSELEGTFKLCYGVDYDLVWVAGTYNYENGFILIGPEGETIAEFQGTGSSSGPSPEPGILTTFQIHMNTCPRPTDLAATNVVYNGATLTWTPGTAEQDLWEVVYAAGSFDPEAIDMIPVQANEPTLTITGLEENTAYSAYARSICTAEDHSRWSKVCTFETPLRFPLAEGLAVSDITAYSAKATWTGAAETYNLRYRPVTGLDESFEAEDLPAGWIANDWMVMPIAQYTMGGTPLFAAEGSSCMASKSMDDSGSSLTPLNVDNWLISPKVDLGGTLEFYVGDLGADYIENFSVYVSTEGTATEDFTAIAENVATPGAMVSTVSAWAKMEYDLSAYEGQKGYIAIRHHDAAGYYFFVDAVKIAGDNVEAEWTVMEGVTSPATMENLTPGTVYECQVQGIFEDGNSAWCDVVNFLTTGLDALPVNLTVDEVTGNTGTLSWEGSQEAYNLRYRTAAVMYGVTEDFTGYETGDCPDGWTLIDADGDGNNWYVWNLTLDDGSTQVTFSSNSYINYVGALTPDNWAITPQSKLGAQVQFDAWGQDPSYPAEIFRVYVSTSGTDQADFVPISEDMTATGTQTTYNFDIPAELVGQMGYIAIRHYNVTDQYILNVTNFYMAGEQDDAPAGEWIEVNNVTSPYTIKNLAPNTKYEAQVQGIYENRAFTDWTESVFFTTEEGADGISEFYMVGSFNGWNQEEGGGRLEFVEDEDGNYTVTTDLEAGAEFKFITPDDTNPTGWRWFGGIDENQVGYFLINEDLLGVNIDLVDGSNFRVEEEGNYTITIKQAPRGLNEPRVMTITKNLPTAITDLNSEDGQGTWFNVQGMMLRGVPTVPGIYIHNGKKVVVK